MCRYETGTVDRDETYGSNIGFARRVGLMMNPITALR